MNKEKEKQIYYQIGKRLRKYGIKVPFVKQSVEIMMEELEKKMELVNQGYGNKPEWFFVISVDRWRELHGGTTNE